MRRQTLSAWFAVAGACRVHVLHRPSDERATGIDTGWRQRTASLVAAYHSAAVGTAPGGPVFVAGWRRAQADGPIELYGSAGAIGSGVDAIPRDGEVDLAVPVGRGRVLPSGAVAGALRILPYWTRLAGIADGLLTDDMTLVRGGDRPSVEDCLLRVWREPFGWLVLAEPVPASDVVAEAARVAELERDARTRSAPVYAVQSARLAMRHRELRQAQSAGLWKVHVLTGGTSAEAARCVAGLVAASVDLTGLPYVLVPAARSDDLDAVLDGGYGDSEAVSPFLASSALLAALVPALVEEVPGVRLAAPSTFDVTAEPPASVGSARPGTELPSLCLGQVLDRNGVGVDDAQIGYDSLNRHMFVTGATGSGKSQTIRALLAEAARAGLPWLVVEPAKAEYRRMASRLGAGRVMVIRPGDPDAFPAGINPLQPAAGFPLQTHLDLVRALFVASFQSDEPFPQVLSTALTRCYTELGWDLVLDEPSAPGAAARYPTLGDLQRAAEQAVLDIGYGREVTENVLGFIRVRLASLRLGTTGRFFEGGHPIVFDELLRHNVVFEIEDVGDDRDKAFLMGTVLIRLVEHLRVRERGAAPGVTSLRHLSVFEEAHRLLRNAEHARAATHAVELFAALLAEVRAYGEGLIIAEQIPSKIVPDVMKNTAVKVVHRLPAADDRQAVGATMNLTSAQSRYLVTLPPGTGAMFADGMDFPLLVRVRDGTQVERDNPAVTASPVPVMGRRSATCGPDCAATPCTLRQMRAAQRLPERAPWLLAWAELSVLAHLTGWVMPVPRPSLLESLRTLPDRLCACAVSHAVDAAVGRRSIAFAATIGPADLAAHVTEAVLARIAGRRICVDEEPRWLATPYRWSLVHDALKEACRTHPDAERHPRSAEWEQAYDRPIPGLTAAGQLAVVRTWYEADLRDRACCAVIAYGVNTPAAIEMAVGGRRTASDWRDRLTETLTNFSSLTWPHRYLVPTGTGTVGGTG
jgi:uncharacterized protein DUF87